KYVLFTHPRPPPRPTLFPYTTLFRSRLERRGFMDDCAEARDIGGMRPGMKIRQECDAQRTPEPGPSGDGEVEPADLVRLRPREARKPTLAAGFVAVGRTRDRRSQGLSGDRCVTSSRALEPLQPLGNLPAAL